MSASKEVDSVSLQLTVPQCGYCRRSIVKNCSKYNISNKTFHLRCDPKIEKCCDVEITTTIMSKKSVGDLSPLVGPSIKTRTSESSSRDLLLKIIIELESKNNILLENNSLLKFKISSLGNEIRIKDKELNILGKKKVPTHSICGNSLNHE